MNTGQMMLGVLALAIVTMTALNFNKGTMNTQDALIYNKEFILATTIAQSVLDEISSKAYDEEIVNGKSIYSANDFSSSLKAESGETYPDYDDIDDFNNFSRTDTIPQMGVFNVFVQVDYFTDGLAKTSSRTYNKNVTIHITSNSLMNFYTNKQDTLALSSLFSQWEML
jgi:hypothetical protein